MDAENLQSLTRLGRDLRKAATSLTVDEARFLVGSYDASQEYRKASDNQVRALAAGEKPHEVIEWLAGNMDLLESQIKAALGVFVKVHPVGDWLDSITGIGPVISAGLIAHVDITQAPTVGHVWRFAGYDPTSVWDKGKKRPWNAHLKTLCWKIGESFVKVSGKETDVYGKLWLKRKEYEWKNNLAGKLQEQARASLERLHFREEVVTRKWYAGKFDPVVVGELLRQGKALVDVPEAQDGHGMPMLPPARIHARSKRYAVKLFLSHFHEAWYYSYYHILPPKPYILSQPEHTHFKVAPNMEVIPGWAEARAKVV